jgi:hypothetical protein
MNRNIIMLDDEFVCRIIFSFIIPLVLLNVFI